MSLAGIPDAAPPSCGSCAVRRLTLCGAVGLASLQWLRMGVRSVAPGTDLLPQGSVCGNIYVLVDGWACLYELLEDGRRQILRILLAGDVVGFGGEDGRARFGAQAITAVAACIIPRRRFRQLVHRNPELAFELSTLMADQEAMAYEHLTSIGRRTARERVAYLLLELFYRASARIPSDSADRIVLPLTQLHLADALGLTPVHINRMLRGLRQDGIIELNQRLLRVCDPDRLAAAAGFEGEVSLPCRPGRRLCPDDGPAPRVQAS